MGVLLFILICIWFQICVIACVVDLPLRNPYWCLVMRSSDSIKCSICLCTTLSKTLPGVGSKEIGLKLVTFERSPALGIGMTFAPFHAVGTLCSWRDEFTRSLNCSFRVRRLCFNMLGCIFSRPEDLWGFKSLVILFTSTWLTGSRVQWYKSVGLGLSGEFGLVAFFST